MDDVAKARELILDFVKAHSPSKSALQKFKQKVARELHLDEVPTDIDLLMHLDTEDFQNLRHLLMTKPVRTISGVSPIAIMTKPFPCPHGACRMCPSKTGEGISQSYTGVEPSARRARRHGFDPYHIIFNRLEQYVVTGHVFDKVELIIQGGTFLSFPREYQEEVIYLSFKALNDFGREFFKDGQFDLAHFKEFFSLPGRVGDKDRIRSITDKVNALESRDPSSLEEEKSANDLSSPVKCVGLTIETRPDWGLASHGLEMLRFGTTRVELGIQSVFDDVLEEINRGHTVAQSIRSIRELRDLGFKLNFHYMPGLPGIKDQTQDLEGLKMLFDNPDFRPDMIKIYPCIVVKDSRLFKDYQDGKFKPLDESQATALLVKFKAFVPKYCRIMRVERDIPGDQIVAGVRSTNLREFINKEAKKRGVSCQCIRCREAKIDPSNPSLRVLEYDASQGKEFFISLEEGNQIFGFARLRFPSGSIHDSIPKDSAIIRELHVYGHSVNLGKKDPKSSQHRGFGKLLLQKAEEIASQNKRSKMVIISGVGVREYYRKFGYALEGPYMVKSLPSNK